MSCRVNDCVSSLYAKGMCATHYHADWLNKRKPCSRLNCNRKSAVGDLCQCHFLEANPDKKVRRSQSSKKYYRTAKGRWNRFLNQAQYRGITQELTFDQFTEITSQRCEYCGCFTEGFNWCGIDRKDNSFGYTSNNSVPCCTSCNMMKQGLCESKFLEHALRIADWQRKKLDLNAFRA